MCHGSNGESIYIVSVYNIYSFFYPIFFPFLLFSFLLSLSPHNHYSYTIVTNHLPILLATSICHHLPFLPIFFPLSRLSPSLYLFSRPSPFIPLFPNNQIWSSAEEGQSKRDANVGKGERKRGKTEEGGRRRRDERVEVGGDKQGWQVAADGTST